MADYRSLIAQNNALWTSSRYHQEMMATAHAVAVKICNPNAVAVYKKLQAVTTVPWWVIGVIHYRECGLKWTGSLAQGDRWDHVSVHDPRGRGPFHSFVDAAVDALSRCAPFAARWRDWTPGGALTLLELYNGLGYEHHGLPSPYVWSGTTNYRRGKFTSDHHFDPNAVDEQLGCAIILHAMQALDASVMVFGSGPNPDEYPEPPTPQPDPRDAQPPAQPDNPPSLVDQAKEKAKQVASDAASDPSNLDKVKSLVKSKIAWLQGTAATAAAGVATSADSIWIELANLAHKPAFWLLLIVLVCTVLTVFYRWYDHGRGKKP